MAFFYNIVILPIESLIEFVFCFVFQKFDKLGVAGAIAAVSLAVNFLALPLYNTADQLQLKERNLQLKMSRWVKHIKKTFKGDEQFMMLSEYYRQNKYHPLYTLRSSLSIMIEIPFFIAGYHFLSHCAALEGQSIAFLKDLSKPDSLINLHFFGGGYSINLLPILMTVINIASSIIYTKGAPIREKIQVYALAALFLVILYNSPSGLVFYWILNNAFSLAKNIILKTKHPKKITHGILSFMLIFASIYLFIFFKSTSLKKKSVIYIFTILFTAAPYIIHFMRRSFSEIKKYNPVNFFSKNNFQIFLFACIALWLLAGLVLPASVIATSPEEFSFLGNTQSPISYIFSAAAYFFGLFIFWPLCIYKMSSEKTKCFLPFLFSTAVFCALANVYIFKYNYGLISIFFGLEDGGVLKTYTAFYTIFPGLFLIAVSALLTTVYAFRKSVFIFIAMIIICLSEFLFGALKVSFIQKSFSEHKELISLETIKNSRTQIQSELNLSKTEKNVVILFLDRAISSFFPYILQQYPELTESFQGFTYYPNCLSFSNGTLMGAPALLGGYEYTPDEINRRKAEKLVEKHNEALKVMPALFYNAGFEVTVTDPCDANYKNKYGFEVFNDYPEMKITSIMGKYSQAYTELHKNDADFSMDDDNIIQKSSKRFSIMQMLPPVMRDSFYDGGQYYQQFPKFQSSPNRFNSLDSYSALYFMKEFTSFSSQKPTFSFIYNLLMHEPLELLAPDYALGKIDEQHPAAGTGFYKFKSKSDTNGFNDFAAYHVNAAGIKMVGSWISYLQENNVFDNTRIIIIADHGHHVPLECFSNDAKKTVYASFNPLLLVKDFNSHGNLKTDRTLMTNAETVNLAIKGLNIENKNPFTGKTFSTVSQFKNFNVYTPKTSQRGAARMREKHVFEIQPSKSFTVHTDIFDEKNWKKIGE